MKTRAALFLILTSSAAAVVVDRIAITAGAKVITDSEIDLRIRLTAFESGDKPDFSPQARKTAASKLIDEKLVEREMEVGHYPRLTAEARAALLGDYASRIYKSDTASLSRVLATYGLTPADLEDDLARQSSLLSFLNLRFRPAVQVSDGDVRQFLNRQQGSAESGAPTLGPATLNDLRNEIEQRIAQQRADADMETWLKEQRKGTKIVYLEKELAPTLPAEK